MPATNDSTHHLQIAAVGATRLPGRQPLQYLFVKSIIISSYVLPVTEAATALTGLTGGVGSDTFAQLATLTADVAAGVDPVGCALFVGSSAVSGIIQDKAVDAASVVDLKRSELVDRYADDSDWEKIVSVWALVRTGKLLPDSEEWNDAVISSATGNPDRLVDLLETYQSSPEKRAAWVETVEAVFTGTVETREDEDLIDYLVREFDAESREAAVETFLDIGDLLGSKHLYEQMEALEGIEPPSRTALQSELNDGQENVWAALDTALWGEGFRRLTDETVRASSRKTPAEAWQSGMGIRQFHEGVAFERAIELDGDRRTPAEVAGILAGDTGPGLLIQGEPGAGKSTLLRNVAYAWVDADYGAVFYRPSGASAFDHLDRVISAIEETDDQLLIAVEDAAREEVHPVYSLMTRYADDDRVTFLLDSRPDEWANLEPATTRESTMATRFDDLVEDLRQARPAPLTEADCVAIVTRYEAVTETTASLAGEDPQDRGAALYDRLQGHTNAGEMLYVSFLLSGMNGFEDDVLAKVKTIEDPDSDSRQRLPSNLTELSRHCGLLIAVLGAINDRAMRREYLFAVAAELSERRRHETYSGEQVAELLYDGFDGWVLFDGSTSRRYRTYHEFWSYWYLRTLLTDDTLGKEQRIRDRFARCIRGISRLHTGDLNREWTYDLDSYTEKLPSTEFVVDSSEQAQSASDGERIELGGLVDSIYDLAERYPVMADLLSVQHMRIRDALTDAFTPPRVARYAITVGTAYNTLGDLEAAREEFAVAGELLETVEDPPSEVEAARLYGLATVLKTEGEYDAVLDRLAEARTELEGADSAEADRLFAKIAQMTGDINSVRSNFDEARRWYGRITERVADESLAALQADRFGGVARKRGRLEDAADHYQAGLQKARRIGDRTMEATTARHVALVNRRLADAEAFDSETERAAMLAEAADLLDESLTIADQLGDEHERAAALGNLSLVRLLQNQPAAAEQLAWEGISVCERLSKPAEEGWMRNNLADAYVAQGRDRAAAAEYELSRRLNESVGNRRETARSLRGLGTTARSQGENDRADRLFDRATEISEDIGDEHAENSSS